MTVQEAINVINTWIEPMRKTLKGEWTHEFLDAVETLKRKEIEYRWHDLRKDPTDLPTDLYYPKLVAIDIGDGYIYHALSRFRETSYGKLYWDCEDVIAWKEEPFEEEE